jgi:hypothetical protein
MAPLTATWMRHVPKIRGLQKVAENDRGRQAVIAAQLSCRSTGKRRRSDDVPFTLDNRDNSEHNTENVIL